ncbi:hypothetical protein JOM56_005700 [Amanita muscaria]
MQAQQYSMPPHSGYYNVAQNTYPTVPEQYTASNVGDFTSFSRGSSLVYPQDYQYFSHRGLSTRHSSSNFIDTQSIDATVSGLAGNSTDMNYRPEDMMAYQPSWRWTDSSIPEASVPMVPSIYSGAERAKSSLDYAFVTTPTTATSLPTPAAMADMMNRSLQLDVGHQQVSFQMPSSQSAAQASATVARASRTEPGGQRLHSVPDTQSREKKHACSMCHKRFDRPSTLRKASPHLLVHTGEKAFVCDTCGRRFGVASNLNRHVRRCILKPIHAASASPNESTSGSTQSVSPVPSNSSHTQMGSLNGQGNKRTKTRALSSDQFHLSAGLESQPSERHADVKTMIMPKRRRRAPSPSQWIPCSLTQFNLVSEELEKVAPVPLPPVRRCLPREERDSWDENMNATPYHPRGWKNVLPGPGLGICSGFGGKDVRNLNIGGNSSYMLGRVSVF